MVAWIVTGIAVARQVHGFAEITDNARDAGIATQRAADVLDTVPLIGDEPGEALRDAGATAIRGAARGRERARTRCGSRRASSRLGGEQVELAPLAAEVAEVYFEGHPEDLERYGDLARGWEEHDTRHLLNWAIGDAEGHVDLEHEVSWLAGVLEARDFPLELLASNLDLAANVVEARVAGAIPVAARRRSARARHAHLPLARSRLPCCADDATA